jgi:uncharacterized protein YndB with AHSA1/START domain
MEQITDSVTIAAPLAAVRRALTTTEGNRGWWTGDCEFGSAVGAEAAFRFDSGATQMIFRVDELGPARIRMTCVRTVSNPDWEGTELRYSLSEVAGATHVALEHRGWRSRGRVFEMCVGGWRHFMESLKTYVETGVGRPHGSG